MDKNIKYKWFGKVITEYDKKQKTSTVTIEKWWVSELILMHVEAWQIIKSSFRE